MALPAPDREPREKPPLWVIQEAFEGDEPAEQPQDVYILHILRALPPDLVQSLTPDQYQRLKQSLYAYHRRHLLDVRGVIPFCGRATTSCFCSAGTRARRRVRSVSSGVHLRGGRVWRAGS